MSGSGVSVQDKYLYEKLNPQYQQYAQGGGQLSWQQWLESIEGQRAFTAANQAYTAEIDPNYEQNQQEGQNADKWRGRVDEFYKYMMMPLDQMLQLPEMQKAMQHVQSLSQTDARLRGMGESGFSNLNSERSMQDAALGLQANRQGMGAQALQLGLNDVQGLERLREQQHQFDAGMKMQSDQMAYAQGMDKAQGMGGLIGGGLGAVAGGLLGTAIFPGVGTAAGAAMGAGLGGSVGAKMGSGVGGLMGPSAPTYAGSGRGSRGSFRTAY
jgi:hypothetical protein